MQKKQNAYGALLAIMRITIQQFVMAVVFVSLSYAGNLRAQDLLNKRVTLSISDTRVESVLDMITRQTGARFIYSHEVIRAERPVSLDVRERRLEEVLGMLFEPLGVGYTVTNRGTVLLKKTGKETGYPEQKGAMPAVTADRTVTGKVTDEKDEPLPGVNIVLKGTQRGTITANDGTYSLLIPEGPQTLIFSFVGYLTGEVPVPGEKTIADISLKPDQKSLEEVVVIGYGEQRKVTLTGSVASIRGDQMQRNPSTNVSGAIAGLLPGAVALNRTGEPGRDNSSILIRGSSTTGNTGPLVVVDGIQGATGWERINPNDIESISILKDASAAIYGARAANGVILITTKRGSSGKPVISYTMNQGFVKPTRIPKMASSAVFADYLNYMFEKSGQPPRYTEEEIRKFRDGSDPAYINEDWYGKVLKKVSRQNQHNLNIRGGGEHIKYSVSGSYFDQDGMFKNGSLDFKSYSLRANLDADINRYLNVGVDVNTGMDVGDYPAYSTSTTIARLRQLPYIPVYWENGLPSAGIENGENPAVMVTGATGNFNEDKQRFQTKLSFDLKLPWVEGLGADGYFAFINDNTFTKNWRTPWTVYDYDRSRDTYSGRTGGGITKPELTQAVSNFRNSLVNLRLKYARQFNKHYVNTFIAYEQIDEKSSNFSAFRRNYISSAIDELFAGSLVDQSTGGTRSETGRQNFFGRISYNFSEKYLIDFNARYDGSSAFPKGRRFGFFPGVSAAWRVSQENFLQSNKLVTDLKLRVSYGRMGNDRIAAFQNLILYTLGNTGYPFGETSAATQGLVAGVSPNPNITWEVASTYNAGFDLDLLNGLFGLSLDVFRQKRSNILTTRDLAVPYYTGLKLPNENIGVVQNQGIELQLSHLKTFNDWSVRINANMAFAKSKILDISEAGNVPEWQKAEGHSLGAGLYYINEGISRTQQDVDNAPARSGMVVGDLMYKDMNNDGKIDAADRVRLDKTNIPRLTYGFSASVSYRNISLWSHFSGAGKVWQYYLLSARSGMNQLSDLLENRYRPGSADSKYPILPTVDTESEVSGLRSDFWLKDVSYLRLKTLELSYTLPQELLSSVKIRSMRIYVNGNNLLTFDKLKWFDPENSNEAGAFYPQNKIFNVGFGLNF